ncbi:MAG TPA: lysylphosphatidylglycerol synthase transmembrane domain-containing protein [Gemmatimonadaceae bacterium]|nr:lysylphosphatidylglycerol synthase transmembrane domain-containing protein [Gemmatimonadaceae bacterium]
MVKFLRRYGRWFLTAAILVFLVIFARRVDWASAWNAIRSASPMLLVAAFAANAVSLVARAVRWWVFLRPAGAPSLWLATRATIAGAALNNLVLAQGGEAARVVFVSRAARVPSARVLATLALERMFDAVGFMALLAFGTFMLALPSNMQRLRVPAAIVLFVVLVLLYVFVYLTRGRTLELAAEASAEIAAGPSTLLRRGRRYVSRFASSASALASGPRFAAALVLSLVAWAGQLYTYHWCAVAAGISLPIAASLAALLASNIGFLLRATPGGVGVFQVIYAVTVAQFGVEQDPAIAASLLIQTLQILPLTLLGGFLAPEFLFRRRTAGTRPA